MNSVVKNFMDNDEFINGYKDDLLIEDYEILDIFYKAKYDNRRRKMNIEEFFASNVGALGSKNIKLSSRFSSEFILKAINERDNLDVKKGSKKLADGSIDSDDYMCNLVCACVVSPDLKNEQLQKSYNVIGEADLIKTMLTVGEFLILLNAVEDICGFNEDIEKQIQEVKN